MLNWRYISDHWALEGRNCSTYKPYMHRILLALSAGMAACAPTLPKVSITVTCVSVSAAVSRALEFVSLFFRVA